MSQQNVTRLKELLFDKESRDIDELARRMHEISQRAGGEKEFRASVARVLEGALRDAEPTQHHKLSQALAPMVRRTFRTEIASETVRADIAGGLYPKLGDMVRRFIKSAMRDLMDGINRRLEAGLTQNRTILKLRSLFSGRSMAELALADTQTLVVEEIYLIRRGSGELIHRWSREGTPASPSDRPGSNRDTLVSGFLTAITSFAEEAFESDGASLRTLDLDAHRIYLRASPAHLLAAKCSGSTEAAVEQVLDDELLRLLDAHQKLETAEAEKAGTNAEASPEAVARARDQLVQGHENLLLGSAQRLEERVAESAAEIRRSRRSRPLKTMAFLLATGLAAWGGWSAYQTYITNELQRQADDAIRAIPELVGYPVQARVERGGRTIWVSGLTPSAPVRARLVAGLSAFAPGVRIDETLSVLPTTDVRGALEIAAETRSLARLHRRLERLLPDLDAASAVAGEGGTRNAVAGARASASSALSGIGTADLRADQPRLLSVLQEALGRFQSASDTLAAAGGLAAPQTPAVSAVQPLSVTENAEELNIAAEHLGVIARAHADARIAATERLRMVAPLEQRNADLTRQLEALTRRLDGLKTAPTPREALEAYVKSHAVFFSNNTDYRDAAAVKATLDRVVELARQTPELIRVAGYTDEAGTGPRNQSLSQQRADKVAEELVARGLPRQRIVAVGRATALDLAPRTGATSASRRVEFEIGFIGEEAGTP